MSVRKVNFYDGWNFELKVEVERIKDFWGLFLFKGEIGVVEDVVSV